MTARGVFLESYLIVFIIYFLFLILVLFLFVKHLLMLPLVPAVQLPCLWVLLQTRQPIHQILVCTLWKIGVLNSPSNQTVDFQIFINDLSKYIRLNGPFNNNIKICCCFKTKM